MPISSTTHISGSQVLLKRPHYAAKPAANESSGPTQRSRSEADTNITPKRVLGGEADVVGLILAPLMHTLFSRLVWLPVQGQATQGSVYA